MRPLAAFLALLVVGCAAPNGPTKTTVLPELDGERRFEMSCGEVAVCRAEAEFRCGGPFEFEQISRGGHYSIGGMSPYLGKAPDRARVRCVKAPGGQ